MKRPTLVATLLLAGSVALAKDEPKSIRWEETGTFKHVDGTGPHRTSHEILKHLRNQARLAAAPSAVSQDVGDVAVIVDNGAIIIPPQPANPFDLPVPVNIRFAPNAGGFDVSFAAAALDSGVGPALPQGDDTTVEVPLGFSFPFLGASYSSIFVNSDGNITLGVGDSASTARDAARLIGGPPRIAAFFADLDVTVAGSINADVRTDRVVVTWTNVPEFGAPASEPNTFQMVLFDSGAIELAYGGITAFFAVVGVAEGSDEGPINEIDLTADLPGSFQAGAIFEEFAPAIVIQQMDVIALAKEFYKTHPDKYDFLVMFTEPVVDIGFGAFAFHLGLKNEATGFGVPVSDDSALAGSAGELESILNMNRIGLYWPDANKLENPPIWKFRFLGGATLDGPPGADQFSRRARVMGTLNGDFGAHGAYTLGLNSAMSIMGQEAGHRWLAFVPFVHPTKGIGFDSFDLLGRDFAHWSFFFNVRVPDSQFGGDPRASSSEGNAIGDLGLFGGCEGTGEHVFLTERNELIDGYTQLDQYLMGLRPAAEVGSFWYVDEPNSISTGGSLEGVRSFAAQDDIAFCGKRVDLTVANIQAFPGIGPRTPAIGDEVDEDADGNPADDVKTMAFILLVEQGQPKAPAHASAIGQVDNFRRTWQTYANGKATGGRGRFDTSLNPAIH
jgi:hypothetical protein